MSCLRVTHPLTILSRSLPVVKDLPTKVSLYKVGLLSALTIDASSLTTAQAGASGVTGTVFGLFSDGSANRHLA